MRIVNITFNDFRPDSAILKFEFDCYGSILPDENIYLNDVFGYAIPMDKNYWYFYDFNKMDNISKSYLVDTLFVTNKEMGVEYDKDEHTSYRLSDLIVNYILENYNKIGLGNYIDNLISALPTESMTRFRLIDCLIK